MTGSNRVSPKVLALVNQPQGGPMALSNMDVIRFYRAKVARSKRLRFTLPRREMAAILDRFERAERELATLQACKAELDRLDAVIEDQP